MSLRAVEAQRYPALKMFVMILTRPTLWLISPYLLFITAISFGQQPTSTTYPETRELLLKMERTGPNPEFKKLFQEADIRESDLIQALSDTNEEISLNAQSIIKYLAEPKAMSAVETWYEFRRTHADNYWISPVKVVSTPKFLEGDDTDLAKLVLKNLHKNEEGWWAKVIATNPRTQTVLLEVVNGEIFTEGWHLSIQREGKKWRMVSYYLVWQS